jgi:hypothetical protein
MDVFNRRATTRVGMDRPQNAKEFRIQGTRAHVRAGRSVLLLLVAAQVFLQVGCGNSPAPNDVLSTDGAFHEGEYRLPSLDDGVPTHVACTDTLGYSLTTSHGRLDGFLVSIVAPGHGGCNADSAHLHLQVRMKGAVYDVAVAVVSQSGSPDVYFAERDGLLTGLSWTEGWHLGSPLDYVQLGVHSGSFTATAQAKLAQQLTTELNDVNHISIFGTGYDSSGLHLIHRNKGNDGAIVVRPLSAAPRALLFHFGDQTF